MTFVLSLALLTGQLQQLGDGRDGALEVSTTMTVNRSTTLSADAAAGDPFILVVDSSAFSKGALVLLVHTQWRSDGERYRVGEYALHFVERVVGPRVEFSSPLSRPWRTQEVQVVLVPQFTDVTITNTGVLEVEPWNGTTGGILAIAATGRVVNDGKVSATAKGLRGGTPREVSEREVGCMSDDEPGPRGAERGEGALVGGFGVPFTGRRNNDTGGGGGNCSYAGGGGGSSLGEGGQGGFSVDTRRDVGGMGGLGLSFAGLVIGGGGGATNGTFSQGRMGARGGGGIFVRARSVSGSGVFEANGQAGEAPPNRFAGASGAGGAGSIVFEIVDDATCSLVAVGGAGGSSPFGHGPGGGGGGGNVVVRAGRVSQCSTSVEGGAAGLVNGALFGAQPGLAGQAAVREVGAQSMPFESGPGLRITKLGCDIGVVPAGWLALLLAVRRRRLRV